MEILEMTLSDLEKIRDKLQNDYDEFWNENILRKELEDENSKYIVIKEKDKILGFAGVWISPVDAQITNIVVKKDSRKNGIGSLLLERLIEIAKNAKQEVLRLEINENNKPAINLYNKYGFEQVGLRKKYYNGRDNAVLMDLKLI